MSRLASRLVLGALGLTLALCACLIEERNYDPQLARCTEYCDTVEQKCTEPFQVYDRPGACMGVCMQMDLGDEFGGLVSNTVACRNDRLTQPDFEASTHCSQAGPGGNGICGSNCQALCTLRKQACGSIPGQAEMLDVENYDICMHNCEALPDLGSLNTTRDRSGDSVQCRLVHAAESMVSRSIAYEHCEHTQTIPVSGEMVPCSDDDTLPKEDDCQKYCGLAMGACENEFAVYESKAQCLSVCRLLDQGLRGDLKEDTVRCRRYHSYNALGDPNEHCTHAGPTGDGHCGSGNCPDYCKIAQTACPAAFGERFGADDALNNCQTSCAGLNGAAPNGFRDGAQRYTVHPPPVGDNVMCRTYHAVAALAAPNSLTECAAALGGSPCE